jgi:histone-lysine N-methyltransferase SETMAR
MQSTGNVQANWQEGYCLIMTMPGHIQDRIQELQREILEHPPYSPDLITSDFRLLKNDLGGKRFADDEEVETEVRKWLRQQSKNFYAAGFGALVKLWDKCINVGE